MLPFAIVRHAPERDSDQTLESNSGGDESNNHAENALAVLKFSCFRRHQILSPRIPWQP